MKKLSVFLAMILVLAAASFAFAAYPEKNITCVIQWGAGGGTDSLMIYDDTCDPELAARNTRISKTSDYGSGCSADGNIIIYAPLYDQVVAALKKEGGYLVTDPKQRDAIKAAMFPDVNAVLFDTSWLRPEQTVCDVVYVPAETRLLREAKARGCKTMSGLWMNVTVAASQMKLWWGIDAPSDFMYQCAANFLRSQGRMQ